AEVGTWSAGDDSGHLLTILLIRSAYDADLIDLGDLIDDLFDLARVDVVSAMDDEVLDAVDDEEIPVLVQSTEVARAEPALGIEDLGGGFGFLPVAGHDCGPTQQHLTHLIGRQLFAAGGGDGLDLDSGHRRAAARGLPRPAPRS